MLGRILGAMEWFGLIFLSAHYFSIEKLLDWQLYMSWGLVIIPIISVITLTLLSRFRKKRRIENRIK